MIKQKVRPLTLKNVRIEGSFWAPRLQMIRETTIPEQWQALNDQIEGVEKSGAVQNFKIAAGLAEGEFFGHVFQDSDLAKWLEAAAYRLATHPDAGLERIVDEMIAIMAEAQDRDGYLGTRFILKEKEKRWTNLRDNHELYVIGHMIEAAVAYAEATGKNELLSIVMRAVDLVERLFGRGPGQMRGYPGHEEIELALVKLYRFTGQEKYLKLSQYFIDERGQEPCYFIEEALQRGDNPVGPWGSGQPDYWQAHVPVRQQTSAEGHAVRAMYLYSAMADLASETGDTALVPACHQLWDNVVNRKMYITGGVGSSHNGEAFTRDYDLPNESAYAETCAVIGLVFFAHRMLQLEVNRNYADVMERALYNGVLSGLSLDGQHYFYVNPLAHRPELKSHHRQKWFHCACCPPNIARLFASLGKYCYSCSENLLYVHLYVGGEAKFTIHNQPCTLKQQTDYPWDDKISMQIHTDSPVSFTLSLRIPGWCRQPVLSVNSQEIALGSVLKNGYAEITRTWHEGDQVELTLPMPVERMESHVRISDNIGRVALQRGPIVYCLEAVDNGADLDELVLPADAVFGISSVPELGPKVPVLTTTGWRRESVHWPDALYRPVNSQRIQAKITAIPYAFWANRQEGEMRVWMRQCPG